MIKPRRVFERAPKHDRSAVIAAPTPVTMTMQRVADDGKIVGFTFMGPQAAKVTSLIVRIDSADKLQLKLRIESQLGLSKSQISTVVKNGINRLEDEILLSGGDMIEVFVDGWQALDPKPTFEAYMAFSLMVRGGSADA